VATAVQALALRVRRRAAATALGPCAYNRRRRQLWAGKVEPFKRGAPALERHRLAAPCRLLDRLSDDGHELGHRELPQALAPLVRDANAKVNKYALAQFAAPDAAFAQDAPAASVAGPGAAPTAMKPGPSVRVA
jgi:hypothetical protein